VLDCLYIFICICCGGVAVTAAAVVL